MIYSDDYDKAVGESIPAEERDFESHDSWLIDKVNLAFAAFERGKNKILSKEDVDACLSRKRSEIMKRLGDIIK